MRADASPTLGAGHVMRCLALAQGARRHGHRVVLATREGSGAIEAKMQAEGVEVRHVGGERDEAEQQAGRIAREVGAEWAVVDQKPASAGQVAALHAAGCKVLLIDDVGDANGCKADLVLNQNLYAKSDMYAGCDGATRLLVGPSYVLLRREFLEWSDWRRQFPPQGRRVLVTLGGADPDNRTERVLDALEVVDVSPLEVTVVIGSSCRHAAAIEARAAASRLPVRVVRDAARMSELMAWADVAVSAAGTTVWELAFMGLPSVVGAVAADQRALSAHLGEIRLFDVVGDLGEVPIEALGATLRALLVDGDKRATQSTIAQALVDGRGCDRVVDAMSPSQAAPSLRSGMRPRKARGEA
jgi:UDP-2,4-diacetamido-2,4,6-trideoxy-beta-L-altropyranose hydrolase